MAKRRKCASSPRSPRPSYMARRLRPVIGEQPMIGLLLPPSVGGALTNFALTMLGRVPVNLNYTASSEVIASCAKQCEADVVITSKAFVERFPKENSRFQGEPSISKIYCNRRARNGTSCCPCSWPQPCRRRCCVRRSAPLPLTEPSTTSPPSSFPAAAPENPRA